MGVLAALEAIESRALGHHRRDSGVPVA